MNKERKVKYGLKGLQDILGCGITTAQKVKNSGILGDAVMQVGRKIIIDEEKAYERLKEHTKLKQEV
jgi:hypothetical protein